MHRTCGQATGHIPVSQENEVKVLKGGTREEPPGLEVSSESRERTEHWLWSQGVVALEPGCPNSNPQF